MRPTSFFIRPSVMGVFLCSFDIALSVQMLYNVRMKEERIEIRADGGFVDKVDYLKCINGYRNRSETIRRTIEKEYRKEREDGKEETE